MANGSAGIRTISAAERIPPHNLEAEQSLIGSMFLSMDAAEAALLEVKSSDFYRPAHAKIFAAIEQLFGRGEPVDIITVADRLEAEGQLEQVGGKPYLLTVTNVVPTAANAMHYAGIVKRAATMRRLIGAGTQIARLGYEAGDEVGQVVEDAERALFEVTNERVASNFRDLTDLLKKGFEQIAELSEQKRHITGVPTGFGDLDRILAGMHRGDLLILAARPSVGKTAFALNAAVNAAKAGTRVAVFSLEMSSEQLIQRILCAEARIDSQRLRTGYVDDGDWRKIMEAMGRLDKCDIHVDDTPASSILEVRSKARRLFREGGPGLIVVDYLQLMQPQNRRSENRQVEIAEISRGLKILAKELDVPVLALSQLSRAVEQRVGKRPQLSDLRECVTGETKVLLADGRRVPIRDLVGTTPEVLAVDEHNRVVRALSDKVWPVGVRPVSLVTLGSGRVVRATGRHRFLTGSGWKRLEDIEAGERVALARRIPQPEHLVEWPEDRIILLGHLVGDGSYLSHQPLRYTTGSEENSRAVAEAARREFGATVTRHEGRGNWHQLVISGNGNRWHPSRVNAWLREVGIFDQRSAQKRLPAEVFQFSDEHVALLLRHLWATDGCVWVSNKNQARRVYFATASRGLAEDVAALLLRVGVVARLRTTIQHDSKWFTVDISGAPDQMRFVEAVGSFGPRVAAESRLRGVLATIEPNTNVDTLPREMFAHVQARMQEQGITARDVATARRTAYSGATHFAFAPSRDLMFDYAIMLEDDVLWSALTEDLFWDTVAGIEPDGDEQVYDLTVPGPASWLADGVVSHNSGAIEQDADVVMFIHRDTFGKSAEEAYGDSEVDHKFPPKGEAEIIVAKHRNGPVDSCNLAYLSQFTLFSSLAPQPR